MVPGRMLLVVLGEVKLMQEKIKKQKIMVVEDEVDIRHVLCFFLQQAGFDTLGVCNGQEAIDHIPRYQPDLVILDLMMYPVSGWDVLHWLRDNHFIPALPIIVMTALVHLTEQIQGFEEGAVEYLTKPSQPSVIVDRVRTLLSLSQEQRLLLQRKRMEEQRNTLRRLNAAHPEEFVW